VQPITRLPPDACRSLEGLVFDIDDTVTREGRLELVAFEAMHRLAAAGLRLLAVTGRPLGWADVVAHHWPLAGAVGENGAGWVWCLPGAFREGYFADAATRKASRRRLARIRDRVAADLPDIAVSSDQRHRRCDLAFDIGEYHHVPVDRIAALVEVIEDEGARVTISSVHAHAVPGEWNKAAGAVRAGAEILDADLDTDRDRWLFVGDSGNDAEAFAWFPLSVGVSNVREHLAGLASPPAYITAGDRGCGFAELASAVLRHRGGSGGRS